MYITYATALHWFWKFCQSMKFQIFLNKRKKGKRIEHKITFYIIFNGQMQFVLDLMLEGHK